MANIIQRILVRTDLGFTNGLMAAQVAHIHMEGLRWAINRNEDNSLKNIPKSKLTANLRNSTESMEFHDWLKTPYIFVHGVSCPEVLEYYCEKAEKGGIFIARWHDTVYVNVSENQKMVFPDTFVGASLGPCDSDLIKAVISDLPLLK